MVEPVFWQNLLILSNTFMFYNLISNFYYIIYKGYSKSKVEAFTNPLLYKENSMNMSSALLFYLSSRLLHEIKTKIQCVQCLLLPLTKLHTLKLSFKIIDDVNFMTWFSKISCLWTYRQEVGISMQLTKE